jgi:hypothetical protein
MTVWIPDSKTPNGITEIPLTEIAVDAFRKRLALSGPSPFLFPRERAKQIPTAIRRSRPFGTRHFGGRRFDIFVSTIHMRYPAQRRVTQLLRQGGCEGIQEVLADEARGAGEIGSPGQRKRPVFWHSRGKGIAKSMGRRSNNSFGISRRNGRGGAI